MNCFHFSVSLGYNTTQPQGWNQRILLWIAFIFQYLWDTTQPRALLNWTVAGCELLSFFSIFGIQHNRRCVPGVLRSVVNCFHFSVSLGYNTTQCGGEYKAWLLWIAFIFQYLWDTTQHILILLLFPSCCELLSFFSIFGIQHNLNKKTLISQKVVNCFHFSVSLGYNTTEYKLTAPEIVLWIAFIFQYLWDTTQQSSFGL